MTEELVKGIAVVVEKDGKLFCRMVKEGEHPQRVFEKYKTKFEAAGLANIYQAARQK